MYSRVQGAAVTAQPLRILLVEDDEEDVFLVRESLAESGDTRFKIASVGRLSAALERLGTEVFDVVLLDLTLPDATGLTGVERIVASAQDCAVVVLTGMDDEGLAIRTLQAGVQDYMVKGASSALLVRSIRYALERKRLESRLTYLAYHDDLTDLANRKKFFETLDGALSRARRSGEDMAVLGIDLDGFKGVNDTLGHQAGDTLLQQVARYLDHCVRETDLVCRVGGDEFSVILEGIGGQAGVAHVIQRILEGFQREVGAAVPATVGCSIGAAVWPVDGETAPDLIKAADMAMYAAKRAGGSCSRFHAELERGGDVASHAA